ncbi:hypothetical protein HYC85_009225 [Camellia sinensis]|uniref:Malic enzyme NAD-binding domain-containing protein n=1 Tax=Camellia sinensis TaxID=4442 RepID=A0A7J7HGD7_CAMSI|nr:hypothetical protein HYC85_009225 [Camellia sinensis]
MLYCCCFSLHVLTDNIEDFAPIIYTPTVGLVCQNYSGLFRHPRGMYFSAEDKGEMMSMIYNWPGHQVDMIVLTDGSRILGLGDLGVKGIGIPIGKLDMYVAAADLGLRQPCLEGKEYLSIVDEFMEAIHTCWPKAIVQGTAGVALAGLLGTVRAQDRPLTDLVNQKIVVVGAGSAGLGVFNMAAQAVSRMAGAEANPLFFLIDKDGLITMESKGVDPAAAPFAKAPGEIEGLGLRVGANLVKVVLKAMRESDSPKPAIFATSNPTMNGSRRNSEWYFVSSYEKFALCKDYIPTDIGSNSELANIQDITTEVGAVVVQATVAEELAEGRYDVVPRELRTNDKKRSKSKPTLDSFLKTDSPPPDGCWRYAGVYRPGYNGRN